jgi:hypothetical protein
VKGSALTFQEADDNFDNLNTDKMESLSDDISPSLGGDLDIGANSIITTDESGLIKLAGITQIEGLALDPEEPEALFSIVTSGPDSNLVFTTNQLDFGGSILIMGGDNFSFGVGAGNEILSLDDNFVEVFRPIITSGETDLVLDPGGNTVINRLTYNETVTAQVDVSGTYAPNAALAPIQRINLTGDITFNGFTDPIAGQSITVIVQTNGSRTLTSSMKWAGGDKTLSTTANIDIITVLYDGSNYWASLAKGFV